MTPNDFLKIIQEEINGVDNIPDGWYRTRDLAKMWNMCQGSVRKKISIGKRLGYVTERKFCSKDQRSMRIPYYFFHEKENNQKNDQRTKVENSIRSRRKN